MTGSNRDDKKTAETSIDKSGTIDIDIPSGDAIQVENASDDDGEDSESDFTVNDDRGELDIDLFDDDPSDRIGQSDVIGVMTPGVGLTAGEISAMIGGAHASPGGVEAILKAILAGDDNELVTRHERDGRDDLWELIDNSDAQAGDDDGIIVASLTGGEA